MESRDLRRDPRWRGRRPDGGKSAGAVSGDDEGVRRWRTVFLRCSVPQRDVIARSTVRDPPGSPGTARPRDPPPAAARDRRRAAGTGFLRGGDCGGTGRFGRQGTALDVRGGTTRRRVVQDQARQYARPRGARRRVGPRPPPRLALEPAPRRPRPEWRVRDAGENVQGTDGPAARVANRQTPGAQGSRGWPRRRGEARVGGGNRVQRITGEFALPGRTCAQVRARRALS